MRPTCYIALVPSSARSSQRLFDRPYLLLVLAVIFWSGNFILGRAVRAEIPPVALAFWRWGLATLLIAPFALQSFLRDLELLRRHWRTMLLLSFLGVTAFDALNYLALQTTPAINALLMQPAIPVLIVGLSFAIFGERITWRQVIGIALSLAGAVVIITGGKPRLLLALGANLGNILAFTAVLCYATYSALLRQRPALHPLSFLFATFVLGTLMLFPFYLWETLAGHPFRPTAPALLSLAYLAIFPSIVSYLCYNRGVALIGANRAGLFIHLMPLIGSLMAVLLLGEAFRLFHALGLVLVLAGVVLAVRSPKRTVKGSTRE